MNKNSLIFNASYNNNFKSSNFNLDISGETFTKKNFNSYGKVAKTAVIFESMANLETLYISGLIFKFFGGADFMYKNHKIALNMDLPNFFNLNRSLSSFDNLNNLIIIGSHPRYEASILNSILRKEQLSKSLTYLTLGSSLDFKLRNIQAGNGFRALFSLLENRLPMSKFFYKTENSSLILGAENFKGKNGIILQNILRYLGSKLFTNNSAGDRLYILHSNITSLNMSNLGLDLSVRSDIYLDSEYVSDLKNLVILQPSTVSAAKWVNESNYTNVITFSTHESSAIPADLAFPIASLYEKTAMTFNIEGLLKKFYQTVSSPKLVLSIEEILLSSFLAVLNESEKAALYKSFLLFWIETGSEGNSQLKINSNLDVKVDSEDLNIIKIKRSQETVEMNYLTFKESTVSVKLGLLAVSIEDFYMTDVVSEQSLTMAHAALFSQNTYAEFLKYFNFK